MIFRVGDSVGYKSVFNVYNGNFVIHSNLIASIGGLLTYFYSVTSAYEKYELSIGDFFGNFFF
jgi:hypothetical protein